MEVTPKLKDPAATTRTEFLEVYQKLKSQLLADSETFMYTEDSRRWVEKMLDHNVPGGKLNRGLSVLDSFRVMKSGKELSEDEKFLASVLGWCIEWLQAHFLVLDDIMDDSITRRGQPCWFRVPQVGSIAINDAVLLRNHIYRILKWHFQHKPYYMELCDLFNEVEFQTASGQMLDLITTPAGEVDLSKYVMPTYLQIVRCKTAYYSFYLPVACALLMSGESLGMFESTKQTLVLMGTYFQVQDDYLDCYGDPQFIGKVGTDIEDTKCSWLIVQALKRADEAQRKLLHENYGKKDQSCVAAVKKVYSELDLQSIFVEYEKDVYGRLIAAIESEENVSIQVVLKTFLAKIYKRQK